MSLTASAASARAVDAARFLRAWAARPLTTGAQLPSGPALARVMAAQVDPQAPGTVVELGPGTGPVTQALLERGIPPERLLLVEFNPRFCALLRRRYPGVKVLCGDAFTLPRELRKKAGESDGIQVAAIVSSLPLATFRPWRRRRLLVEWLKLGTPETPFIQFTYMPAPAIAVGDARITVAAPPRIWRNVWPARVWTYRNRLMGRNRLPGRARQS